MILVSFLLFSCREEVCWLNLRPDTLASDVTQVLSTHTQTHNPSGNIAGLHTLESYPQQNQAAVLKHFMLWGLQFCSSKGEVGLHTVQTHTHTQIVSALCASHWLLVHLNKCDVEAQHWHILTVLHLISVCCIQMKMQGEVLEHNTAHAFHPATDQLKHRQCISIYLSLYIWDRYKDGVTHMRCKSQKESNENKRENLTKLHF